MFKKTINGTVTAVAGAVVALFALTVNAVTLPTNPAPPGGAAAGADAGLFASLDGWVVALVPWIGGILVVWVVYLVISAVSTSYQYASAGKSGFGPVVGNLLGGILIIALCVYGVTYVSGVMV